MRDRMRWIADFDEGLVSTHRLGRVAALCCWCAITLGAQSWPQWGQNPRHTGMAGVTGQRPQQVLGEYTYDLLAEQMRRDSGESLLVHYMAPLVDGAEVFTLSRGNSEWVSCRTGETPCGTARWAQMEWGVTKLRDAGGGLEKQWSVVSSWKPPPDNGSGWEPVFHPALDGNYLYVPAASGMVMKVDRRTGEFVDCYSPFDEVDVHRYVTSALTMDRDGSLYYTVMKLDAAEPWLQDVREAWIVKIDANGHSQKARFADLVPDAPSQNCATSFSLLQLPWPPAPDAKPPVAPCGSQRPGLNAAPAVAPDGTVYFVSRAHFNSYYSYLVAVNGDLSRKWSASLRNRLNDGCDVLLPPSGQRGGCRVGSRKGVDPTTNDLPAGRVLDQSTASPVVAPDGSILYGAATRYNYSRGHLMRFSANGEYLSAYDFGWDITPAIDEHDGTWSAIVKDNFYNVGSYCPVAGFCDPGTPQYSITRLNPDMRREWAWRNTNDQLCERLPDGSLRCATQESGFEWCVNMVAIDRDGVVYANSEDGNLYAIDRAGQLVGRMFLKAAIGAAYTPLAIGQDGRVYTQNDGTLFAVGARQDQIASIRFSSRHGSPTKRTRNQVIVD